MGLNISQSDVLNLMNSKQFMNAVIKKAVDDPEIMDDLTDSIADELSDILEGNTEITSRLLEEAMTDPSTQKKIIEKCLDNLN